MRNLNLQLDDYDEMFLIRGKCVKIAHIVRVNLSLSGGYIVGGDRGVGKDYPEGGMHAPHLTDELYSVVMRKKHVLPELYRKFR